MARILSFHGLSGGPDSPKVWAMRSTFGRDNVQAPEFPFSRESLGSSGIGGLLQTVAGLGAEAERIAREACAQYRPDLLVGASLGGGLAMRLALEQELPAILLAPVWNTRIKEDYLPRFLARRNPGLQNFESLIPLLGPGAIALARQIAGIRFAERVGPRTLILHSPEDELFDLEQSRRLLENSPLSAGSPDAAFMDSITRFLVSRGHRAEGRLVVGGGDHQMNGQDALRALVDAVQLLLADAGPA